MKLIKAKEKGEQSYPAIKLVNKAEIHSSRSFFATVEILSHITRILRTTHNAPSLRDYATEVFRPPGRLI
jgi:hypothetical protein